MIRINLLPRERARRVLVTPRIITLAVVGVVIVALVGVTVYLNARNARVQAEIEDLNTEIAVLAPQVAQVEDLERRINALRQREQVLKRLDETRVPWETVLSELAAVMPRDVWLTRMGASADGSLTFTGNGLTYQAVARFMLNLDASPMFEAVDLSTTRKVKIGAREVATFSVTARRTAVGREASR
ncbi:MAG TPA: PilN domain-containing protein [bacterium]|nr:PilN domain-containing protein [bacterium]